MEKEKALLEMDFGELVEFQDDGTISKSPPKETSGSDEEKPDKESKEDSDTLDVDIGEILSGEGEVKEGDETEEAQKTDDSSDEGSPDSGSKDEEEKEKKSENEKDEDTSGDPFTLVFARYQLEQGNLTELNEEELKKVIEEDGENAAMSYLFEKEIELNRNAYLEQYEEDAKELREYMELKDAGADTETAKRLAGNLAEFDKISVDQIEDEDNVELRKAIMTQNYKNSTRFSDAKIKKLVDNSISLGEDIDEAKEALESIKDYNKETVAAEKSRLQKEREVFEETHKRQIKDIRDKIYSLDEVLPGQKINKQTKQKIEDMLLKPVGQDPKGNQINKVWQKRLDSPLDFDIKLAYLISTGYFDGKTDKLVKATRSKVVDDMEQHIKNTQKKPFSTKPASREEDIDPKTKDALESMRNTFKI